MNWTDLIVLGVIVGFGLIGLFNGFILSVYRVLSFFVAAFLSIKLYPLVSDILMKTPLSERIQSSILDNLLLRQDTVSGAGNEAAKASASSVIDSLSIPEFLKPTLLKEVPNPMEMVDVESIMQTISTQLTEVVIGVISLVGLYIVLRIGLFFVKYVLQGIAKLPVFKQMDKVGGVALGGVEGLLTVYIVFAVLMLFNSSPHFQGMFDAIDNSLVAKFFYENNFIVDWMFKG